MTGEPQGKVALVTGAGAGIGTGIARRFAEERAAVVVAERDERTGRDVAEAVGGLLSTRSARRPRAWRSCARSATIRTSQPSPTR